MGYLIRAVATAVLCVMAYQLGYGVCKARMKDKEE